MNHHFGLSGKARPVGFVLRGNSYRASIQMALPGHHAADSQERRRSKSEFPRAQASRYQDVPRKFQAAIHAQRDPVAQARASQSFVRLPQANLPRQPGILDGRERRRSRAATMPADSNYVRPGLGHARGDDAHAGARDQLHADSRTRIYRPQIVNQLRQVFDAVDIVVRRRGD